MYKECTTCGKVQEMNVTVRLCIGNCGQMISSAKGTRPVSTPADGPTRTTGRHRKAG